MNHECKNEDKILSDFIMWRIPGGRKGGQEEIIQASQEILLVSK